MGKTCFERRVAAVHIEVAIPLPAQMRMIERHLNTRAWRNRPPLVITVFIENKRLLRYRGWNHAHCAADAPRDGHRDLIDADRQRLAVP